MKCAFSPAAEHDIEDIGDYIARDNPSRAISFIQEVRARCIKITMAPEAAPLRHELGEGIRMATLEKYLIFYTLDNESVRIERILHGAHNILGLFGT